MFLFCSAVFGESVIKSSSFMYEMSFDIDEVISHGTYSYTKKELYCETDKFDFDFVLAFANQIGVVDITLYLDCFDEESRQMSFETSAGVMNEDKFVFDIPKINISNTIRICSVNKFIFSKQGETIKELNCIKNGFYFKMEDSEDTHVNVLKNDGRQTIIQKIWKELEYLYD
jgi:hypothetical protein